MAEQLQSRKITNIRKRDGSIVPFNGVKIYDAILKAGAATGDYDGTEAQFLTLAVIKVIDNRYDRGFLDIEAIQDIVEQVLITSNYLKTARAYIIYREQHKKLRGDKKTVVDVISSVNEYLYKQDWRVNANANQGYSLGGMILNISGKVIANYWLSHVYPEEVSNAHRHGDVHIHDLDMLSGYCAGWSLKTLLREGFNGVPDKVESGPPKDLSSAVGRRANFLGTWRINGAGAQAFSSFDTYLAPYIRIDKLPYEKVKQSMQEFIYNLNVPSRWGTQTPFTNVTFDWVCPEDLRAEHPIVGGKEMDFTYGELGEEMAMINKAYIEVMMKGDSKGRVFTFPIPTYNITPDFDWDHPNCELLFEMTAKYGLPYFQNFLNSDLKPNQIRSMCCRLQLDLRELLKRGNGLFGSAEQTGSLGVVTLNCARIGYLAKGDESALFNRVDYLLQIAKTSLELKRKIIQRHIEQGLFPYTKRYLGTLRNHFSTIGLNGVNECIRNFTNDKENITTEEGFKFAIKLLDHIRMRMTEFQTETGHLYNLEATPAEGATYRFAKEDIKRFPDILHAGTSERPYYTNSSQLPVAFTDDPFEALERQEQLQRRYTGGTVLHLYMGERVSSHEACKEIIKRALTNYRIPYITITPTFSICPRHGYLSGEHEFCPKCDEELIREKMLAMQGSSEPTESKEELA